MRQISKENVLELFGSWEPGEMPASEFSRMGATKEFEYELLLSSMLESEGDSSSETIGFTSAAKCKEG